MEKFWRVINTFLFLALCALLLTRSVPRPENERERVRAATRMLEFDYIEWTLDAVGLKWTQAALNLPRYLAPERQRQVVDEYAQTLAEYNQLRVEIAQVYIDPAIANPDEAARDQLAEQARYQKKLADLAPLAESVLQMQMSALLAEQGLTAAGQPLPPLLYHVTALPYNLVVSPREVIRQDVSISLLPDLTLQQITRLEKDVEADKNLSALVTPIGGVGTYPTMVAASTNLGWLLDTVAHEWTHNYLTLRPLGLLYEDSPEMRTINETTAAIAGEEISRLMLERYYPDLLPPPAPDVPAAPQPASPAINQPPVFDYRAEMHATRVGADRLLALGRVEDAEKFMEVRRLVFLENGYGIRRLNQAYFAFYGAYAAGTVGAQGSDPVGPLVRDLRARSDSLADFINRISWVTSWEGLQKLAP